MKTQTEIDTLMFVKRALQHSEVEFHSQPMVHGLNGDAWLQFTTFPEGTFKVTVERIGGGEAVRDPDVQEPERACPKCKDQYHLYQAGADVRWRPEERRWDHTGDYDQIECTECDWTGTEEDTEVKPDG